MDSSTDVMAMDKDQLDIFAVDEFGVMLNKRLSIETLQNQVKKLMDGKDKPEVKPEKKEAPKKEKVQYLKNVKTNLVFMRSDALAAMIDLHACDKKGKLI